MEIITIISLGLTVITVGIMLADLILHGQRTQRAEMRSEFKSMREEIAGLRARMAHVEGLLESLPLRS